ncbi:MAG: putative 2OG-Fe(II) oxygenase [Hyphomonadaceae bacterium]|nr:putative 2OG-Fe(II) oxygenase [Hyphomonadaceae bacterium]
MISDFTAATREAQALKAAGRLEESIALNARIAAAFPNNNIALHNLASALGDAGRWAEADRHIRAALALSAKPAETWLLAARAAQALGRLDESEHAFREAIQRKPLAAAHRELAQLRWMRGADIFAALADLDAAPPSPELTLVKAQALHEAGETAAAIATLTPLCGLGADPHLLITLAQFQLAADDIDAARANAQSAIARIPSAAAANSTYIEALLAAGDLGAADAAAALYRQRAPLDQHAIALQATVWRAQNDPRYRALYDYDAFFRADYIDPPPQWSTREAYLEALRQALAPAHLYATHPFAQSVRRGSQAPDVMQIAHPAARALPEALAAPIQRYLDQLGAGGDPLRARKKGGYCFQGMWSVRLQAGGRHINHVHPQGWISAVTYVDIPPARAGEGAIAFGQPGLRLATPLSAERTHQPKPGEVLFFPSYMWHGVRPFTGAGVRLTIAFDLVPR